MFHYIERDSIKGDNPRRRAKVGEPQHLHIRTKNPTSGKQHIEDIWFGKHKEKIQMFNDEICLPSSCDCHSNDDLLSAIMDLQCSVYVKQMKI
jgi:hypothetical protein